MRWWRREPIFTSSRSYERRIPGPPRTGLCPWGGYRVSASNDRQRNRENWPRPFGFRRKSGHTSFSPLTVDPPQPAGSASHPSDQDLSPGTPASSDRIFARGVPGARSLRIGAERHPPQECEQALEARFTHLASLGKRSSPLNLSLFFTSSTRNLSCLYLLRIHHPPGPHSSRAEKTQSQTNDHRLSIARNKHVLFPTSPMSTTTTFHHEEVNQHEIQENSPRTQHHRAFRQLRTGPEQQPRYSPHRSCVCDLDGEPLFQPGPWHHEHAIHHQVRDDCQFGYQLLRSRAPQPYQLPRNRRWLQFRCGQRLFPGLAHHHLRVQH